MFSLGCEIVVQFWKVLEVYEVSLIYSKKVIGVISLGAKSCARLLVSFCEVQTPLPQAVLSNHLEQNLLKQLI